MNEPMQWYCPFCDHLNPPTTAVCMICESRLTDEMIEFLGVREAMEPKSETQEARPDEQVANLEHLYQCSIELQRDAKGTARWGIKSYHDPGDEAVAIERIRHADDQLAKLFGSSVVVYPVGEEG